MPVPVAERPRYFLWKEWVLGEERYAGRGTRSSPRPNVGYGDPSRGQDPVPESWWAALEEHLARRHDHAEPGVKPRLRDRALAPARRRAPADPRRLTPHFHADEFNCHDGRRVPKIALPALDRLATELLEPLRREFGPCDVMSGYRPADYNRRIGGARFSQHIYELSPSSVAADLIFRDGDPEDWHRLADRLRAGGVGLYPSFVHVDNRPGRARWSG